MERLKHGDFTWEKKRVHSVSYAWFNEAAVTLVICFRDTHLYKGSMMSPGKDLMSK